MKYIVTAFAAIFLFGCTPHEKTAMQIYNANKDGVVLITNELPDGQGGLGTGFIVDDNIIVTNDHVIDGSGKLNVYLMNSKRKYEAEVLYTDKAVDIAILKLKNWTKFKDTEKPVILVLGDSAESPVGSRILAMGHPWGLSWSISEGIISAKNRRMDNNPKFLDQVDAHVFQGNSGGPVFDTEGEVICINELMLSKEGGSYGFCIPSNLVKKVLYDFKTFKEVRWRAMNVEVALTDDGSSVILKTVEPNGAAGKAGLKDGDKVLRIYTPNNHPQGVEPKDPNDLITEMAQLKGDEELIKLEIERNGEKMMFDVKTNYRLSKEYPPASGK